MRDVLMKTWKEIAPELRAVVVDALRRRAVGDRRDAALMRDPASFDDERTRRFAKASADAVEGTAEAFEAALVRLDDA
jgi:hypothetical protein